MTEMVLWINDINDIFHLTNKKPVCNKLYVVSQKERLALGNLYITFNHMAICVVCKEINGAFI